MYIPELLCILHDCPELLLISSSEITSLVTTKSKYINLSVSFMTLSNYTVYYFFNFHTTKLRSYSSRSITTISSAKHSCADFISYWYLHAFTLVLQLSQGMRKTLNRVGDVKVFCNRPLVVSKLLNIRFPTLIDTSLSSYAFFTVSANLCGIPMRLIVTSSWRGVNCPILCTCLPH